VLSQATLTAGTTADQQEKQRQQQQQIPFGDDNQKGKCNSKDNSGNSNDND
jgi:hypothetical protein